MIAGLLLAQAAQAAQVVAQDTFATVAPWQAAASDGVAARLATVADGDDRAMRLDYDFGQVAGYAYASRSLPIDWPGNFALTLRVRGTGGVNDLQIKFVDAAGENVWWIQRKNFRATANWQTMRLRPRDLGFAWGPAADKTLHHTARVEIVVVRGRDGAAGHLDVDDLRLEGLPPPQPLPPVMASDPAAMDGNRATVWHGRGGRALVLDFGGSKEVGGLLLHWAGAAPRYTIATSQDARHWQIVRTVTQGDGGDDPLALPDTETRYIKIALPTDAAPAAVSEVEVMPLSWAENPNAFVQNLARKAPRGTFPRSFSGDQSYWRLVGTDGGTQSGLIGEDGAIEVARGGYSIEPFIVDEGKEFRWSNIVARQSLEAGYLPLPHVTWDAPGWQLDTSVFADVTTSRLVARYRVTNTGTARRRLRLVLAIRPFQVNPAAQFLSQQGGVSPIGAIVWAGGRLAVTSEPNIAGDPAVTRFVAPVIAPNDVATAAFDQGALMRPTIPTGATRVNDPTGLASAALGYTLDLSPGQSAELPVALPFDGAGAPPTLAELDSAQRATAAHWQATLGRVTITVPPAQQAVADSVRTALADMLMSRQGPALQPGTRSYDRSWIRDGAMISDALLRFGIDQPVIDFANWYGGKLFAHGKVPCCVDRRGPDPVPENDAQGEYIHLVTQLYRFTGDRRRLEAQWPALGGALAYMEKQRQSERTGANLLPDRRMLYGLMPPSISHEGYSAMPQYSLWDDFWALTGYKDAAYAARVLDRPEAAAIAGDRDQFAGDLHAAITASVKRWGIDYLPGAISLGDFDATSTTMALDPAFDRANLDPALLANTFERQWERVMARQVPGADWNDYTPYEWRNVGAMVRLGWRERANQLLDFYMTGRRPAAWNGWAEVVGRDLREIRFIGDMPHAWVASDFVRTALDLFAYDGGNGTLVLGGGFTNSWLVNGGSAIHGLRTQYGSLNFEMRLDGDRLIATIGGSARPPAGFLLPVPLAGRRGHATINGRRVRFGAEGLHIPANNDGRKIEITLKPVGSLVSPTPHGAGSFGHMRHGSSGTPL